MPRYTGERDYVHDTVGGLGVLITNLGTPDAPTPAAVRRYLAEFLWDPRVVEIPRPLWWLILHGIILRTRPRRSAAAYAKVWSDAGSPLLDITRRQARALQHELDRRMPGRVSVAFAMRYGTPSIPEVLETLRGQGMRRLLLLPLYPQYSATTTASTFDAVAAVLRTWRWLPALRVVDHYHDHPAYIASLATSIREHWAAAGRGERLLFSFHGLPRRNLLEGDPYHCQCQKTARLVAAALGLGADDWFLSFQSRLGRAEWLKPYTDETLKTWGAAGAGHIDVVCPGFSADCLETLEEIALQNGAAFTDAGGGSLRYVPALNDRADHIALLADLATEHIAGWPEAMPDWSAEQVAAAAAKTRQRAERLTGSSHG